MAAPSLRPAPFLHPPTSSPSLFDISPLAPPPLLSPESLIPIHSPLPDARTALQTAPERLPAIGEVSPSQFAHLCSFSDSESTLLPSMPSSISPSSMLSASSHLNRATDVSDSSAPLLSLRDAIWSFESRYPSFHISNEGSDFLKPDHYVIMTIPVLERSTGIESLFHRKVRIGDFWKPLDSSTDISSYIRLDTSITAPIGESASVPSEQDGAESYASSSGSYKCLLESLYRLGSPSPCCKASTGQISPDETVHRAREITATNFSVSEDTLEAIENLWKKALVPTTVRAVPHKITFYGPSDYFRCHKDAPEKNLVGTFYIGLTDPEQVVPHLKVYHDTPQTTEPSFSVWNGHVGTWTALYSNVPHEVVPSRVFTPTHGYRGVLSFKIYASTPRKSLDRPLSDQETLQMASLLRIVERVPLPVGILLRHDYTTECNAQSLKGSDALLYITLSKLPNIQLNVIPVFTDLNREALPRLAFSSTADVSAAHHSPNHQWTSSDHNPNIFNVPSDPHTATYRQVSSPTSPGQIDLPLRAINVYPFTSFQVGHCIDKVKRPNVQHQDESVASGDAVPAGLGPLPSTDDWPQILPISFIATSQWRSKSSLYTHGKASRLLGMIEDGHLPDYYVLGALLVTPC